MTVALAIEPATPAEVDVVLGVLNDAAQWTVDRGAAGWRPGIWTTRWLLEGIERGETFLARRDGTVVATITLQWSDPLFWGERPPDAGYVHRLAVTSDAHGEGIGRRLVEWAERVTVSRGRPFLRLDTAYENPKLCAYYEALGFAFRGEKTLTGDWGSYHYALYEKRIAP